MRKQMCVAISIVLMLHALAPISTVYVLAQPLKQSYVWFGQLVTSDKNSKTVTVTAPYREHINRYIGGFKPGDKLTLIWATPRPGETDAVIYVGRYDGSSSTTWGYVLPVQFVSADTAEKTLTFTVTVPSKALKALEAVPSGGWIKVTTPFDQPSETAAISSIEEASEQANPQS